MPLIESIGPLTLNLNTGDMLVLTIDTNGCSLTGWGSATPYSLIAGVFSATFVSGTLTLTLSGIFQSNILGAGTWTETGGFSGNWAAHLGGSGGLKINGNAATGGYTFDGNGDGLNVTFNNFTPPVKVPVDPQSGAINSSLITGSFSNNTRGSGDIISNKRSNDSWEADSSR